MQPPPQAVPSGVAGPPPAGNPRSMFWANSPYRKPANNAPVAPITRPLQPVTDPFAFNRQTLQNTPVGSSNPESPPTQGQSESLAQPPASPASVNTGQLLPQPPQASSASVTSTNSSQAAVRSEQLWLHPPPGASGVYQAFPRGPSSEAAQEGDAQPYFSQSVGVRLDKQSTVPPANDAWGDVPGTGTRCASGPQCENVENLEFVQNQEVLPRETLSVDPFPLSDQIRYGPLPGPAASRPATVGLTRGGGLNLEAPDTPLHPTRPDSVSSSYSSFI